MKLAVIGPTGSHKLDVGRGISTAINAQLMDPADYKGGPDKTYDVEKVMQCLEGEPTNGNPAVYVLDYHDDIANWLQSGDMLIVLMRPTNEDMWLMDVDDKDSAREEKKAWEKIQADLVFDPTTTPIDEIVSMALDHLQSEDVVGEEDVTYNTTG